MKEKYILNGLLTVLLISAVTAYADGQYPASDFKPTVVYQDEDYIAKSANAAPAATSAPAAAEKSTPAATSSAPAADEKYPASNFQPSVVYNDPDYKHSSSASSQSTVSSPSPAANSSGAVTGKTNEDSSFSFYIGLVVFAFIGYFFFKKRPVSSSKADASTSSTNNAGSGLTGVAKYLNRKSGTGVARYLEKQVKSASATAVTGVARYLSNQAGNKEAKSAAKTGVEKYLRNRG